MGRAARTAVVLALLVGASVATAPSALAAPNATAAVDVSETLAGTQETYAFTVTNTSNTSEAPINHVSIRTSKGAIVIDDVAAEGWTATLAAGIATFRLGSLAPGASQQFFVLATASPRPDDELENWNVKVSNQDGINSNSPPDPQTQIRVLSVDSFDVVAPEGVLDYEGTQGQLIELESTVSNYATTSLNVDATGSDSFGQKINEAEDKILIQAGSSATFRFTSTLTTLGTHVLTGAASDPTGNRAITTTIDDYEVAPAPSLTYATTSLSPPGSVSQASQVFTASIAKNDSPAVYLDPSLTKLSFRDNGADVFSTTLAAATTIDEGDAAAGLTFAPLTIPNVANKSYSVRLTLAGEDDNGKTFNQVIDTTASFVKEDGMPYAKPQIAAPQGQVEPDGMPVVKDGDMITLSGDIKTSAAPGAPFDPTAQILDCDLAVLDGDFVRVGTIDVPLIQCQNAGGHFSGQIAPTSIGVTDGFLRLEAQVKKAVGGAASPPDQISNLIAVDNDTPAFSSALLGCAEDADAGCNPFRTLRMELSEPVYGNFLPADFTVSDNVVVLSEIDCVLSQPCRDVTLTLLEELDVHETPTVGYSLLESPLRSRPRDGAGHRLGNQSTSSQEEFPEPSTPEEEEPSGTEDTDPFGARSETGVSPPGEVAVVSANVKQIHRALKNRRCRDIDPDASDQKTKDAYKLTSACRSNRREVMFAERIRRLANKSSGGDYGDGMGDVAPDLILLQETRCKDADRIANALEDRISIPVVQPDGTVEQEPADYKTRPACTHGSRNPVDKQGERHEGDRDYPVVLVRDTAIMYLTQTMQRVADDEGDLNGTTVVTKHGIEALNPACRPQDGSGSAVDARLPYIDDDGNGENDCKISWKEHRIMAYQERDGGLKVAAASVHLASFQEVKGLDDEEHDGKAEGWLDLIAETMRKEYSDETDQGTMVDRVDHHVLAGDLNIERCDPNSPAPMPSESPSVLPSPTIVPDPFPSPSPSPSEPSREPRDCDTQDWWDALTDDTDLDYFDSIYEEHSRSPEQDMDFQYRDGCNEAQSATSCFVQRFRRLRIDFMFLRRLLASTEEESPPASHDLTCGMDPGLSGVNFERRNCDRLINRERYSDHRLVWSFLRAVPSDS